MLLTRSYFEVPVKVVYIDRAEDYRCGTWVVPLLFFVTTVEDVKHRYGCLPMWATWDTTPLPRYASSS